MDLREMCSFSFEFDFLTRTKCESCRGERNHSRSPIHFLPSREFIQTNRLSTYSFFSQFSSCSSFPNCPGDLNLKEYSLRFMLRQRAEIDDSTAWGERMSKRAG